MSIVGEVDLGAVANSMPLGKYKKKRRMDRRARDYGTSLVVKHIKLVHLPRNSVWRCATTSTIS